MTSRDEKVGEEAQRLLPVFRLGSGKSLGQWLGRPVPAAPVANDGVVDLGMKLHPPGISDAKDLSGTDGRGGQVGGGRGGIEGVVVPLKGGKGHGQPGHERITGARRGLINWSKSFLAAGATGKASPHDRGQELGTQTDAEEVHTVINRPAHEGFERQQIRKLSFIIDPHVTAEDNDRAKAQRGRQLISGIEADRAKGDCFLIEICGEDPGRNLGIVLDDRDHTETCHY